MGSSCLKQCRRIECHSLLGKTSYFGGKADLIVYIEEMWMFPFQMVCSLRMNTDGIVKLQPVCLAADQVRVLKGAINC